MKNMKLVMEPTPGEEVPWCGLDEKEYWERYWETAPADDVAYEYERRIFEDKTGLIDFLASRRALRVLPKPDGRILQWVELEGVGPDPNDTLISDDLISELVSVYIRWHEDPEKLAKRLEEVALPVREPDPTTSNWYNNFVALSKRIHEKGEAGVKGNINWGPFVYYCRGMFLEVSANQGSEAAMRFARGIESSVGVAIRDFLGVRFLSKKRLRIERTDAVNRILREKTKLRTPDRDRIALLIGEFFGDEKAPPSKEAPTSRLRKRREKARSRPVKA